MRSLLPPYLRGIAGRALIGSRSGYWPDGTADAPAPRLAEFLATWQLLWVALITLPVRVFLAPLLLGELVFRRVAYLPAEMAAVAIMGIVVVAWSAWLVVRVVASKRATRTGLTPTSVVRARPRSPCTLDAAGMLAAWY